MTYTLLHFLEFHRISPTILFVRLECVFVGSKMKIGTNIYQQKCFEWAQNTWSELNKQESYDILCGYMTSLWQIFTRCSYLKLFGLIQKNPDNQKSRIGKIICLSYIREGFFYNAHHINRNKRIVTCKRRSRFPCRRNQKLQTDRISILLLVALFCLCGRKEH